MNKTEFSDKLLTFIRTSLLRDHRKKISRRTRLFEEGLINSMKIIDLIAFIEKTLAIEIKEDTISMEHFDSVEKITSTFVSHEKK